MVIQAGHKLFQFPTMWTLAKESEIFGGISSFAKQGVGKEGDSDEKPIIVTDSEEDFEAFSLWLFQCKWVHFMRLTFSRSNKS